MVNSKIARSIVLQKILRFLTSYQLAVDPRTIEQIGKHKFADAVMVIDNVTIMPIKVIE